MAGRGPVWYTTAMIPTLIILSIVVLPVLLTILAGLYHTYKDSK